MPRSEDVVLVNRELWDAVRDGVVASEDLSPSLRLRESLSATLPSRVRAMPLQPLAHDWRAEAARLRANLPYGRQLTPAPPNGPPSPSGSNGPRRGGDDENVDLNIMRAELVQVEKARVSERDAASRRERALFKVVEGFCEYHSAHLPR